MKAAKEEWTEKQYKNIETGVIPETARRPTTPSRLSPRPNSISQKTQQHKSEDPTA